MKVIIDSDIGDDITDAFALGFALKSKLNIQAILSNNNHEISRAKIIHKLVGKNKIPVFAGIHKGKSRLTNQKEFVKNYNHKIKNIKDNLSFFKKLFRQKIYYISLGTLSNVDFFLKNIPNFEKNVKIIMTGGSIKKDYHGKNRKRTEWNISCDIKSAQNVFRSNLKITMFTLDTTWNLTLDDKYINRFKESPNSLNQNLFNLHKIWKKTHRRQVIQYDSPVIAYLLDKKIATLKQLKLAINDKGHVVKGNKKVEVATNINKTRFKNIFLKTIL